jgi:hypothetical protein
LTFFSWFSKREKRKTSANMLVAKDIKRETLQVEMRKNYIQLVCYEKRKTHCFTKIFDNLKYTLFKLLFDDMSNILLMINKKTNNQK